MRNALYGMKEAQLSLKLKPSHLKVSENSLEEGKRKYDVRLESLFLFLIEGSKYNGVRSKTLIPLNRAPTEEINEIMNMIKICVD